MTSTTKETVQVIDRSRYRKILWFFAGVIAHLVWWDLLLGRVFKGMVRRSRPNRFRRMSRRFRELAVEMGGVMIKLGQFLSSRVDVLPVEVTEELAGLQDEVPPVPYADVEAVLLAELGDIPSHFSYFEPEPLAAASLGQAHCARLAASSESEENLATEPVVVKVQRPGIEDLVRTDLAALQVVARWAMRYRPIRRRADIPALMEEFSSTLWEELDYESEAENARRFAEMFAGDRGIRIPAVYSQHSTRRVLVLEDVGAIKITDVEALSDAGIDRSEVAHRLLDAYFYQIFKEGFFHADPHPGNLFVQPLEEESGHRDGRARPFRLIFVDFGMVGHIEQLMGDNLRRVLVGVTQRDSRELTEAYNDLGFFLPGSDLDRIAEAQELVLDHIWGRNLLELSQPDPREVAEISQEFKDLLFEFPFQVPQDFIFLGRAFGMLSGLASLLDPTINPWQLVERYGREIIRSRETWEIGIKTALQWLRLLVAMPSQAQRVLAAAESGRLRMRSIPDRAVLRRLDNIEKRAGRPNWSVLAASLFLGGVLFYINGQNTLAAVCWVAAVLLFLLAIVR